MLRTLSPFVWTPRVPMAVASCPVPAVDFLSAAAASSAAEAFLKLMRTSTSAPPLSRWASVPEKGAR